MRRRQAVAAVVLAAFTFTACAKKEAAQPAAAPETPKAKPFQVALLTPGPISDAGWNAGAYEGLKAIEKELGATISHVQVGSPSEYEEQFRAYASKGYALCFGHGFEFQDSAAVVAKEFPKTVFITTSGSKVGPNQAPIVFELEQAAYLAGLVAGRMTKTAKAGMVGGKEIPSIASTFLAFEAGFKAGNPGGKAIAVYTGSFEDVAGAKAATLALADQKADFIFHNADAAALGVFKAATERGIYAFGSNKNQNDLAPSVLASAVIDMTHAYVEAARLVKDGKFDGKPIRYGLSSKVISFVINPALAGKIPAPVLSEVERTTKEIEDGRVIVPRGNF